MNMELKYKNMTPMLPVPDKGTGRFRAPIARIGMLPDSCMGESDERCWQ